jgi:RecB family endonuclease NucS
MSREPRMRVRVASARVRLVIARCSVDYAGRLTAHLPEAVRLIMVKADGCVAVHADGGAYKPLNWMNAPNTLVASDREWVVNNPKGELLTITLHEVLSDTVFDLGADPGLRKDGVEAHLQELLAANPAAIEAGFRLVRREYPTAIGPIDLVCRDADGQVVAVEIKRRGEIDGVEQLTGTSSDSTSTPASGRCAGFSSPSESSPRRGCSPRRVGSAGSRSTTTSSAASLPKSSGCSDGERQTASGERRSASDVTTRVSAPTPSAGRRSHPYALRLPARGVLELSNSGTAGGGPGFTGSESP